MARGFIERINRILNERNIGYGDILTIIASVCSIISFYLKYEGIFEWISYEYLAAFVVVIFIFEAGVQFGRHPPDHNRLLIKGCINRDGACWTGSLVLKDGKPSVDVVDTPSCAKCSSELTKRNANTISMQSCWGCPECRSVIANSDHSDVSKQFEHHFEKITSLKDISELDGRSIKKFNKEDPSELWMRHVKSQADDQLSTCCIDYR